VHTARAGCGGRANRTTAPGCRLPQATRKHETEFSDLVSNIDRRWRLQIPCPGQVWAGKWPMAATASRPSAAAAAASTNAGSRGPAWSSAPRSACKAYSKAPYAAASRAGRSSACSTELVAADRSELDVTPPWNSQPHLRHVPVRRCGKSNSTARRHPARKLSCRESIDFRQSRWVFPARLRAGRSIGPRSPAGRHISAPGLGH
jgi:hypothetical protein